MSENESNCENNKKPNEEAGILKDLECSQIVQLVNGCPCSKTEYLDNFAQPNMKKPVCEFFFDDFLSMIFIYIQFEVTRSEKMEQLFMKEMYEEYIIEKNRIPDVVKPEKITEYIAAFKRDYNRVEANELIKRYPLYGDNTITCYNKTGNPMNGYKKKVTITKAVAEQDTQFG